MRARVRVAGIPTAYAVLLFVVASSILMTFHLLSSNSISGAQLSKTLSRESRSPPNAPPGSSTPSAAAAAVAHDAHSLPAANPSLVPAPQSPTSASEPAAAQAPPESPQARRENASQSSSAPHKPQNLNDPACLLPSSSLTAITPSSPDAPILLPWPSQLFVGSKGEGRNCEVAGTCCGPFTIGDSTPVLVTSPEPRAAAAVQSAVRQAATAISALSHRDAVLLPKISVCIDRPFEGPNAGVSEAYSLRVSGDGIIIACDNSVGLAWALASLQQLLAHWSNSKMCVALIVDKPLLGHRGVLLDVARNFVPLPDITLLLRTMSAVKLNVLHMHLTDDQAFTFASASCPEFSSSDPSMRSKQYSPSDLREIVKTAAGMGIRIIPELDVPGHAAGFRFANSGYVASCPAYVAKYKHWGIPLNPAHPHLMAVVARLIHELSTIFPDKYLHLGGDEVSQPCWLEDPAFKTWVQSRQDGSIANGDGVNIDMKWRDDVTTDASALLMLDFMKVARENRKSVIVYQEVFDHQRFNADEHSLSQIWISKFALTEHVNRGVNAISAWGWYLNHGAEQCNSAHECYAIDHLRNIDGFKAMSDAGRGRIMGGEMALWEVPTTEIQDTLWPRAGGIAERLWSGHVEVGSADQQREFLLKRLQLLLDDAKLLGWLKCADCSNAAKKARK